MKTLTDKVETLNKLLFTRYAKKLAELNKNIWPAPKNDAGELEVPTIDIGPGGGALIGPTDDDNKKLPPPAQVTVKVRAQRPSRPLYRVFIPITEIDAATNTPSYANYLFDKIMSVALSRYAYTYGTPEEGRFGECYVSIGDGLKVAVNEQTGEDGVILTLTGSWIV